jgi:RNA polymerase sigma factor (sigma-70 family)
MSGACKESAGTAPNARPMSTTTSTRFDDWLREYGAILHHVANGFATGADRHDLLQELMLAVWRAAPQFRGESAPSTFIFRVTHNAALTWKRGERRRAARFPPLADDVAEPAFDPGAASVDDRLAQLYAALHRLEPVDRSLILLQLDGASYAQIAEIHGITESNVGVRLNRIRHKLTALIQEQPA